MSGDKQCECPGRNDGDYCCALKFAEASIEIDRQQPMTKQEIEALGQATLKEHGLSDWRVCAVREEDDTGDPEDDIEAPEADAITKRS